MLRLLKLVILIVILLGVAVGGTIYFMSRTQAPAGGVAAAPEGTPVVAPVPQAPIFAELDPFTVTLYGESRSRILYVAITLRVGNLASSEQIRAYMPEVRDRILKVLSSQSLDAVQGESGRDAMSEGIKKALSQPFAPELPAPAVSDVLFTAFVVQ